MSGGSEPELAAQDALQHEALQVVEALHLGGALTLAGRPVQLGSSVLGLMTWRDIDFHVYCDPLDPAACFASLRPVATHSGTLRLTFANRRGDRHAPNEPDGYYAGIRFETRAGDRWKIDVWFVEAQPLPPELELMDWIRSRLTPETRLTILRLKSIWHDSASYRDTVTSVDIYDAVLERGVRTADEFETYLRRAGKIV